MFNLGTLLQVSALTMGVASATPICNAKENQVITTKNENNNEIVNNYSLTLSTTTSNTQSYVNNIPIGTNWWNNTYAHDDEYIQNFQGNNSYVNVIASRYRTLRWSLMQDYADDTQDTVRKYYIQNIRTLNNYSYDENATTDLYVFQIDSYNYNLDTNFKIDTQFEQLSNYNWYYDIQQGLNFTNLIYIKETYICYQNNWSNYLQQQNVSLHAKTIKQDIENVNNGFYYTKETTTINYTDLINDDYIDQTDVNLTTNGRTFVIIKYTPCMTAELIIDTEFDSYYYEEEIAVNNITLPLTNTPIRLVGRHIIPNSNYEVIDIPGLMWEILTMPFAFVSQAFNLTLFPGTPYQLNISNLFLSIIAVIVFIWLIGFFLKMKG